MQKIPSKTFKIRSLKSLDSHGKISFQHAKTLAFLDPQRLDGRLQTISNTEFAH